MIAILTTPLADQTPYSLYVSTWIDYEIVERTCELIAVISLLWCFVQEHGYCDCTRLVSSKWTVVHNGNTSFSGKMSLASYEIVIFNNYPTFLKHNCTSIDWHANTKGVVPENIHTTTILSYRKTGWLVNSEMPT